MGIALAWLNHPVVNRIFHANRAAAANAARYTAAIASVATSTAAGSRPTAASPRGLRVMRLVDPSCPDRRASARLILSGPLDQVCAELDRLVALEAAR